MSDALNTYGDYSIALQHLRRPRKL